MTTIITCAVTGAVTTREQTPYLPVTPEEIASSALEAAEAGAAVVHIHVRDPKTGKPSSNIEYYKETVDKIRKQNRDVLINLTTGPGAVYLPNFGINLAQGAPGSFMASAIKRVEHIQLLKPELCSLDFNTMHQAGDGIRINHKRVIKEMLRMIQEAGTKPELEIFDSGDLRIAKEFLAEGLIKGKPFWQLVLGVKYGWGGGINVLTYAYRELEAGSVWSALGIGKDEMPTVAHAMTLGGHVRVGMEDNIYTSKGVLAKTNAELVTMAAAIIKLLGGKVASCSEAREILLQ
ncbi:MAG: hypothetical protein RLZZ416_797 [Candidatus Parcubacteria bacterium]|jgi:uncharacterized protein (DUF849 family)